MRTALPPRGGEAEFLWRKQIGNTLGVDGNVAMQQARAALVRRRLSRGARMG
jgi:hypothetical protein